MKGVGKLNVDCLFALKPPVACGNPGFYPGPPGGSWNGVCSCSQQRSLAQVPVASTIPLRRKSA